VKQVFAEEETDAADAANLTRTQVVEILGRKLLDIETLEPRNRDSLDFH
jgi:hypothetical protein